MPNFLGRFILFLSSYTPLFIIYVVLFWQQKWIVLILVTISAISITGLIIYLQIMYRRSEVQITPSDVRSGDAESMSYVVTYIFPFLSLGLDQVNELVALIIFFVVIAILYINGSMIHINPVLSLSGFRLYELTLSSGSTHVLISRSRVVRNEPINVIKIDEEIYLLKSGEQ